MQGSERGRARGYRRRMSERGGSLPLRRVAIPRGSRSQFVSGVPARIGAMDAILRRECPAIAPGARAVACWKRFCVIMVTNLWLPLVPYLPMELANNLFHIAEAMMRRRTQGGALLSRMRNIWPRRVHDLCLSSLVPAHARRGSGEWPSYRFTQGPFKH